MEQLKVKLLRPNARLPLRASDGAAAYDLYAAVDDKVTIAPGQLANIPIGIAIEPCVPNAVALIFSRSGHGMKHGVSLVNSVGVVDADYRGEIQVGLVNHGSEPFTVCPGDRIAQLMLVHFVPLDIVESDTLSDTARGAGGFGSTGNQ